MKGISNLLMGIAVIGYIVLGLFQFAAIVWGLDELGVPWFLAGLVAVFVTYIPIVGGVCAAYGLVITLDWSWPLALAFPFLGMFCLAGIGALANKAGEHSEARA